MFIIRFDSLLNQIFLYTVFKLCFRDQSFLSLVWSAMYWIGHNPCFLRPAPSGCDLSLRLMTLLGISSQVLSHVASTWAGLWGVSHPSHGLSPTRNALQLQVEPWLEVTFQAAWIILQQINGNPIWAEIRNQPSMREWLHSNQTCIAKIIWTNFHLALKIDDILGCLL